jgi:hypothetical protein
MGAVSFDVFSYRFGISASAVIHVPSFRVNLYCYLYLDLHDTDSMVPMRSCQLPKQISFELIERKLRGPVRSCRVSAMSYSKSEKCQFCGESAYPSYSDTIAHFGGGWMVLCEYCIEINDLMWDLAILAKGARWRQVAA